jgi:hypothetical protein
MPRLDETSDSGPDTRPKGIRMPQNRCRLVRSLIILRWEPPANLGDCAELVKRFWAHVGIDDNDYEPGAVLKAKPDWIRKCFPCYTERGFSPRGTEKQINQYRATKKSHIAELALQQRRKQSRQRKEREEKRKTKVAAGRASGSVSASEVKRFRLPD